MVGGECNYLLRVDSKTGHLAFVRDCDWKSPYMMSWSEEDIRNLLRGAERVLMETANRLRLPVKVRVLALRGLKQRSGVLVLFQAVQHGVDC